VTVKCNYFTGSTLQRRPSLAFGFGTSAYAKDRCHPTVASLEVGYPAFVASTTVCLGDPDIVLYWQIWANKELFEKRGVGGEYEFEDSSWPA